MFRGARGPVPPCCYPFSYFAVVEVPVVEVEEPADVVVLVDVDVLAAVRHLCFLCVGWAVAFRVAGDFTAE